MKTTNTNKIKVTIREVADTLGWDYEDARAVCRRKSPESRYEIFRTCEQNLIQAKKDLKEKFQTN